VHGAFPEWRGKEQDNNRRSPVRAGERDRLARQQQGSLPRRERGGCSSRAVTEGAKLYQRGAGRSRMALGAQPVIFNRIARLRVPRETSLQAVPIQPAERTTTWPAVGGSPPMNRRRRD